MLFRSFIIPSVVFTVAAFSAGAVAESLIPIEHFARKPAMGSVTLSPHGDRLAYLMNDEGRTVLATYDLKKGEQHLVSSADNEKQSFRWFSWANNDQLLVSILIPSYIQKTKVYETRLAIADWNGEVEPLVKSRKDAHIVGAVGRVHSPTNEWTAQFQDNVISDLPDDSHNILLAADFEIINRPTIYKVNLETKVRSRVLDPLADVTDWIADDKGEWVAGTGLSDGVRSVYIRKLDDRDSVRKLWEYDITKESGPYPLGFDSDPKRLIVSAPLNGRSAIYAVNILDKELKMELLASDEQYDITGDLIYSPATENYVGVYYEGSEGRHVYWDSNRQALQKGIDHALPGSNRIVSFSKDESRYVLLHSEPNLPDVYLLGDRNQKTLDKIGSVFPELEEMALPQRKTITLKARDGLTLEGYLTLPVKADKSLPAVVFPHGGPSGRDTAEFDHWAAFIASRGYAVLQINFRGSSGYGYNFALAQMHKWGLELQDDITDATQWMVEQKIADPRRICIVGHSYGGYAALMGATKTPDLFRCAVGSAGAYDLIDLINHASNFYEDEILKWQFGSKWFDRDRLKATSPIHHVDKVKIPVLIIHGDEDRSVPVRQGVSMAKALKGAKKNVKFILQQGGDHHFRRYDQRLEFLSELEAFLDKHLGNG